MTFQQRNTKNCLQQDRDGNHMKYVGLAQFGSNGKTPEQSCTLGTERKQIFFICFTYVFQTFDHVFYLISKWKVPFDLLASGIKTFSLSNRYRQILLKILFFVIFCSSYRRNLWNGHSQLFVQRLWTIGLINVGSWI